jgi:hypothetical protein
VEVVGSQEFDDSFQALDDGDTDAVAGRHARNAGTYTAVSIRQRDQGQQGLSASCASSRAGRCSDCSIRSIRFDMLCCSWAATRPETPVLLDDNRSGGSHLARYLHCSGGELEAVTVLGNRRVKLLGV